MFRKYPAIKDTYITDKIIRGTRKVNSNVGQAGTIDIYKIYGNTFSSSLPQNELSRGLIKFDLSELKALYQSGSIDISHPSFNVHIKMYRVFGGQTTPNNFKMIVFPVSKSWDEGIGRDVSYYSDIDSANMKTASYSADTATYNLWNLSGANRMGLLGSPDIDIISSGALATPTISNLFVTQSFINGTEDLYIDVTQIVSGTIAGLIPDEGFRISYSGTHEVNDKTYFVTRFASQQASNARFHPKLEFRFNDSIIDNHNNIMFDQSGTLFLYNYGYNGLQNLVSGTALTQITGSNSLVLWLKMEISGGYFSQSFTASQHQVGNNFSSGIYSSSFVLLSNNQYFKQKLLDSGSVRMQEIWASLDDTVAFVTSSITIFPFQRSFAQPTQKYYTISANNIYNEYRSTDVAKIKIFVMENNALAFTSHRKTPQEIKSIVFNEAYYSVRDLITNEVIIPFDLDYKSTQVSTDSNGMYFDLHMGSLDIGRTYIIDLMIKEGMSKKVYQNISQEFKVV
jgi:hypothetical protein